MKGWITQYAASEEFEAKSNHILAEIPLLPDEWKISLKLKPKNIWLGGHDSNVILLTNGIRGFSPPRIFVSQRGVLTINGGVNKPHSVSYFAQAADKLRKGEEWVEIQISQEFTSSLPKKLMYRVVIDGEAELIVENKTPQFFENVKLYTGYETSTVSPFNGRIKDLSIKIKEDNMIKYRHHYSKDPPSGEFNVL